MARPSGYTEEIGELVCAYIVEGLSLRRIAAMDGMPALQTMFNWMSRHPTFMERYARAKEAQMDAFAEEIVDIADDGTNDWMEDKDSPGWRVNGEHIQRSRLRVDSRKWLMAKMRPKKYGDSSQVDVNLGGQRDNPIELQVKLDPAEAYKRLLGGD